VNIFNNLKEKIMFLFGKKTSLDLGWYPGQLHCSDTKLTHKCPRNRTDIQCASITLTISFPANLYFSVELCLAKVVEGAEAEEKEAEEREAEEREAEEREAEEKEAKETREDAEEIRKAVEEELWAGNQEASQEASLEALEGGFVADAAEAPWEGEVVQQSKYTCWHSLLILMPQLVN
jgi:hypothetical protein